MLDNNKEKDIKRSLLTPASEVPDVVYLQIIADGPNLLARAVRVECDHGFKLGCGYIDGVKLLGEDRYVTVRLFIRGGIYTGHLNWDDTRFCAIKFEKQFVGLSL